MCEEVSRRWKKQNCRVGDEAKVSFDASTCSASKIERQELHKSAEMSEWQAKQKTKKGKKILNWSKKDEHRH